MRFRRPRTPTNTGEESATSNLTSTSMSDTVSMSDTHGNLRTWPCSNCHATVSNEESACPYCGGIQVTIPRSPPPTTIKAMMRSNLLLERLAATPPMTATATAAATVTATTAKTTADETETSAMSLDEQDLQEEGPTTSAEKSSQAPRPNSAVSQSSSNSRNESLPTTPLFFDMPCTTQRTTRTTTERPPDPVAVTLETAQFAGRSETPVLPPQANNNNSNNNLWDPCIGASETLQEATTDGVAAKRKAAKPAGTQVPAKRKMVVP